MADDKPANDARVGIFVIIAAIMLTVGWSWLHSISLFHPPQRFVVQFHDIAGLNNNATVNVNGVRVGTVEKIELKGKGQVLIHLKINTEDVTIPQGSTVTIQTLGLVGAKYVEITLPELAAGADQPPPISPDVPVIGQDPVRTELMMNKMARSLSDIDFGDVQKSMSSNMERIAKAADSVQDAAHKFGSVADSAKNASNNANKFFSRGTSSFDQIEEVASTSRNTLSHFTAFTDDWRQTSHKLNKILDNPLLSSDLKDTAQQARETAQIVQNTMHEFSGTLKDEKLRNDLLSGLQSLKESSENISKSVGEIHKIAGDQGLRDDVKAMLTDARTTMSKVNDLVQAPTFGADLKVAVDRVKTAATDTDHVARQLRQVLDEKHPLWKMLTGRPGYLKPEEEQKKKEVSHQLVKTKEETASSTGVDTSKSETPPPGDVKPPVVAPVPSTDAGGQTQ